MAPLTFIIAGGGYAGLATAIELARKNIRVTIYESVKKLTNQGLYAIIHIICGHSRREY